MKDFSFPLDSILVWKNGKIIKEEYQYPYGEKSLHRMFSMAKSYTSLAIGALICEGKLHLTDKIGDFFPEMLPEKNDPFFDEMTIHDMLRMRTCFAVTTYKNKLDENWVGSYFSTKPDHAPGMIFKYDTSAALVLSALVEKITGRNVIDYLRVVFLNEAGFSKDAYFMPDPFGTGNGGSGLMAYPKDILLTGMFLLSAYRGRLKRDYPGLFLKADSEKCTDSSAGSENGNYDTGFYDRFEKYIKDAMSYHTATVHEGKTRSERYGYGYMFWMIPKGGIMMYGMGGQYLVIYPDTKTVVVTTADTQSEAGGNQRILDAIEKEYAGTDSVRESMDFETTFPDGLSLTEEDKKSGMDRFFGTYEITKKDSYFSGFVFDEKKILFDTKEGKYVFFYETGRFGEGNVIFYPPDDKTDDCPAGFTSDDSFGLRAKPVSCAIARYQPDGSIYIQARLTGEDFGMIHFMIAAKEDGQTLLYIRKAVEFFLPCFNGFFDARKVVSE